MYETKLEKTLFKVDYKPTLSFHTRLMNAAEKCEGYPGWETTGLQVTLSNAKKHCSLDIQHNCFLYDQDSDDEDLARDRIQKAINTLTSELQLEKMLRFGLRRFYLIRLEMPFSDLVSILKAKLFSIDRIFLGVFTGKVLDLMYRVDYEDKPYRLNVTAGPVRKTEVQKYIPYDRKNHLEAKTRNEDYKKICEGYPDVGLLFDIDISRAQEKLTLDELNSFLEYARQESEAIKDRLLPYLFSDKLAED